MKTEFNVSWVDQHPEFYLCGSAEKSRNGAKIVLTSREIAKYLAVCAAYEEWQARFQEAVEKLPGAP